MYLFYYNYFRFKMETFEYSLSNIENGTAFDEKLKEKWNNFMENGNFRLVV